MRYLLIFHGAKTRAAENLSGSALDLVLRNIQPEIIREVTANSADELRGAIELIGAEISERRGVMFLCDGVEIPDEDEFDD